MASSFSVDISKFAEKVEKRADTFVQGLILRIDSGVVNMTPVDTGRARGNWNVGINNVDLTEHDPETNAQSVIERAKEIIKRIKAGDVIYTSNNVEYIEELENGSSDQAPNGMVAVTLRRFPGLVVESVNQAKKENP